MPIKAKQPYQLGYFLITHRPLLKKIAKYCSIFLISLIWLNFIINAISYLTNIKRTNEAINGLSNNYVNFSAAVQPQEIIISDTNIFNREPKKYDLFVILNNPNINWQAAEISYQFIISGENIPIQTTYLLPSQEKFIVQPNVDIASTTLPNASFKIVAVQWRRIKEQVPQINFSFDKVQYLPVEFADSSADSDNYSRLTAIAINKSIYGFKEVKVAVLLTSQNKAVGVGIINLNNFLSGEQRSIEFLWPRKFPYNPATEFNVDTNILNHDNLITQSNIPN